MFLYNHEAANGLGILKHVLGNKRGTAPKYIAKDTGVNIAAASKIMEMAAPLVQVYLGKQSKSSSKWVDEAKTRPSALEYKSPTTELFDNR